MKEEKMMLFNSMFPSKDMDKVIKAMEKAGVMDRLRSTTLKMPSPPNLDTWRDALIAVLIVELKGSKELADEFMMFATILGLSAVIATETFNLENFKFNLNTGVADHSDVVKLLVNAVYGERRN